MKKLLLIAVISVTLLSCRKDCWKCYSMGTYNGMNYDYKQKKVYCGDDPGSVRFTDDQGNDLNSQCDRR